MRPLALFCTTKRYPHDNGPMPDGSNFHEETGKAARRVPLTPRQVPVFSNPGMSLKVLF